jgi:prepilin signal peptidase PulO-like enzyme (type II secretory pathway)
VADGFVAAGLAVVAALVAAAAVRATAEAPPLQRRWWVAGLIAAPASAVAYAASPVPVAPALAAGGIVAAAVVDAVEGRIPTPVANGTTAVSVAALGVYAGARHEGAALLLGPGLLALALAGGLGALWLARAAGLGDVRLAAATVTAMVSGAEGPLLVAGAAFATAGLAVVGLRLAGRSRPRRLPFGPGLAIGWLVAILVG